MREFEIGRVLVGGVPLHGDAIGLERGHQVGRGGVHVADDAVDREVESLRLDDAAVGGDHDRIVSRTGAARDEPGLRHKRRSRTGIAPSASITWVRFAGRRRGSRPLSPVARAPRWFSASIGRDLAGRPTGSGRR